MKRMPAERRGQVLELEYEVVYTRMFPGILQAQGCRVGKKNHALNEASAQNDEQEEAEARVRPDPVARLANLNASQGAKAERESDQDTSNL